MSFPLCDPSLCTGCTACAHSCPVSAISMKEDAEGFDYRKNICFIESIDQNDYIGNNKKLFKEWYNFAGLGSSLSDTYNQSKFIENLSTNIKINNLDEESIKHIPGINQHMIDNINNMPPYPNKNFIQKYNDILS